MGLLLRRVLLAIPTLFGLVLLVFLLSRLLPGDVVTNLIGPDQSVSPERLAELRRLFGLDLPLHVQFGSWFRALCHGDLGTSLRTGRKVAEDLALRAPITAELSLLSLLFALGLSLPLSVLAAALRASATSARRKASASFLSKRAWIGPPRYFDALRETVISTISPSARTRTWRGCLLLGSRVTKRNG